MELFSKDIQQGVASELMTLINEVKAESQKLPSKRYFKKKDFCQEVGISFNTLQKWINELGFKVVIIDGLQLIDMQDAVEFFNKHKK